MNQKIPIPEKPALLSKERKVLTVAIVIALTNGLNSFADLATNYLYKDDYQLTPAQASGAASFIMLPWLIKPCWGLISDNYVLFGYRRKSYVIIMGLIGFISYLILGIWSKTIHSGIFLLFFTAVAFAFQNVIGEALLVESAQRFGAQPGRTEEEKQKQASENVSTFFGVRHFGMIITVYTGGLLLEYITKQQIFLIASTLPLIAGLFAFILPENKKHNAQENSTPKSLQEDEEEIRPIKEEDEITETEISANNQTLFLRLHFQ